VFNTTFKNISVTTFVAEIGEPREIHRPVASHWQTLSHNVLSSTPRHEWGSNTQLKWWYATIAQVVVIRNSSRLSPSEKTSWDMNSILYTAWLMKSHDITMEDRHPRNVGFSHQGFVLGKLGDYMLIFIC
jgi:hypothetical protein